MRVEPRRGRHAVVLDGGQELAAFDHEEVATACMADMQAVDVVPPLTAQVGAQLQKIRDAYLKLDQDEAKPKTTREAAIQAKIVATLEKLGADVTRLNSGHVVTADGRHMQLCKRGTPDLLTLLPPRGRAWFLEIKTDTGVVSPIQKKRHAALRATGAIVEVVRSPAEAARLWAEYTK